MQSSAMMKSDGMMEKSDGRMQSSMMAKEDGMMARASYHQEFTDAVLTNGHSKVLFFYAAWCPYCRAHDTKLQSWYGEQDLPVSTYKVDYDASLQLRARYGVLTQHTFVLIDGKGNKIASVEDYPSDEEVLTLIRTL